MAQPGAWRRSGAGPETARQLLTWFTSALAAGAVAVLVFQVATGVEGAAEALLVLLLLISALLLAGARRPPHHGVGADRAIAAVTVAAIDALDRVEYRRLELGTPWPQLVVGPTGVSIVELCPRLGSGCSTTTRTHATAGRSACGCAAARATADRARQLLAGIEDGRQVPVRVLAVVPPGTTIRRDAGSGAAVDAVPADRLADMLARGPVLPMTLVDRAFGRLASLAGALLDR